LQPKTKEAVKKATRSRPRTRWGMRSARHSFKKARQTKLKKERLPQFVNPGAGQAILDKINGDQSGGSADLKTLDEAHEGISIGSLLSRTFSAQECTVWCENFYCPAEAHSFSPPRADKNIEHRLARLQQSDKQFDEALTATRTRIAAKKEDKNELNKEMKSNKSEETVLGCLCTHAEPRQEELCPNLCTNVHEEYEKIEVMIDSGASETVASEDKFASYNLVETTATGTTYSSAAEKQAENIVNVGQKFVQVVDEKGNESWAKFQMCRGLGQNRILGSVSRLVEAGHTVVFRSPELGSYIQNNGNGYRTYLRQHNGSYYLDLWVKRSAPGATQPVEDFTRQGR
jgi:hypothetical protein